MGQGILGELYAVGGCHVHPTNKYDECRTRTYHQGIREHAQGLYQSLLNGMAHSSHGSRIRCTTLARLVAEQASLNTLYYGHAKHSARSLIESESVLYNGKQHLRQRADVPNHHSYGYQKIDDSHYGDNR